MGLTNSNPVHRRPVVAVIGASSASESLQDIAYSVGELICREGWHLLTGGGGGVMAAACRGFQNAKCDGAGQAIGILPEGNPESANAFVDIAIPTGMGITRNALVARAANALVAVGGCSGTLSEMALAWQLGRPVAACAQSGGWAEKLAGQSLDNRFSEPVFSAVTPDDAISFVRSKL